MTGRNERLLSMQRIPSLRDFGAVGPNTDRSVQAHRSNHAHSIYGHPGLFWIWGGPCSPHDLPATIEFIGRSVELAKELPPNVELGVRLFGEKPRSGPGWTGPMYDPRMDGSFDVIEGVRRMRMMMEAATEADLAVVSEVLDPVLAHLVGDYLTLAIVGARSVENQSHHNLASGLSCSVGFKNTIDGRVSPAANAVIKAADPRQFIGVTDDGRIASFVTTGNPNCTVVLRGGDEPNFEGPNFENADIVCLAAGLGRSYTVDCNHGQTAKNPLLQPGVAFAVASRFANGDFRCNGVMMEAFLEGGRQDEPKVYGQSVTDSCLGWMMYRETVLRCADIVAKAA